jgi:uncharacterized protein
MRPGVPKRIAPAALASALLASLVVSAIGPAVAQEGEPMTPAPTHYVRMSDGVLIAVQVRLPDGYVKGRRYPTIFEMSGYDGASASERTIAGQIYEQGGFDGPLAEGSRYLTEPYYDHYVTVHASVRGTGCSGGEFDLFSWRSALDGRAVIEWIARRPWSNGKVGIYGHSYGGMTGFMIAATRPPHLRAVTVSGLIDDLYRGITYPGGVSNIGFPLLWTLGVRPAYDEGGGTAQGVVAGQDATCAQNAATQTRTVVNDPVIQGLLGDTDNDWWRSKSMVTYAERIEVPIHITGAWQDEQTGPRFPHLFEVIRGVPKRMIMTNGHHGTDTEPPEIKRDRVAWMDHWIRGGGGGYGSLREDRSSVVTLFEMHHEEGVSRSNGRKVSSTFPLPDTQWTDWYLRADGGLTRRAPEAGEGSDTYFSGSRRQSWSYQAGPTAGSEFTTPDGPDEVAYATEPVTKPTAIAGPIVATVFASSSSPDTELFVQLIDVGPDGSRTYLQRGMLRASHRALEKGLSDYVRTEDGRVLYRPFHPHVNPTPITPGQTYEYTIEVFPVGHVFRPGHRIMIKIHAPPTVDSYYAYAPKYTPGFNTIVHDAEHPSRIQLPVVPLTGVTIGPEIPCGQQEAVRCIPG